MRDSTSKGSSSRFVESQRSSGRVRAVKIALCAALLATTAGAQPSVDWKIDTFTGSNRIGDDGPATAAQVFRPASVAVDGSGNLYIADTFNHRIRKLDSSGTITTIAGSGERGFGGPAVYAQLRFPWGVATDGTGNLYIADQDNHRIRKVDSSGIITTIAGTAGRWGSEGDGGPATEARLSSPYDVAVDGAGNLYFADWGNHRIRKVDSSGTITTIAGSGETGYDRGGFGGDGGPAVNARLSRPAGIALDGAGNLYFADTENHRIRVLTPPPETGPSLAEFLNAAGFIPGTAPASLQSLFGERLAPATAVASALPLLAELVGVGIEVIDGTGAAHEAQLLYVSPGQINFLMPDEAAPGAAVLRLTREGEEAVELAITIDTVAPGLFSANGTGEGIGAITALRVAADAVQATIGDSEAPVLFAGAQGGVAGLDQVDVGPLPRSLVGRDEVNVVVTAAGITSNTVTIVIE